MCTRTRWIVFAALWFANLTVNAAALSRFDDITFWTGSGENRAALVIDWDFASADDAAWVWGYRWTGVATGEEMLRAVVTADRRLFSKLGTPGLMGLPVYGFGYDFNHDSAFSISGNTVFDEEGFAETGIPDSPPQLPAISVDPNDHYAEGFFTGFWHYAVGAGNPFADGDWLSSAVGVSGRQLADGDWDGWTFAAPASLISTAFAENPRPAEMPLFADFDRDFDVDGTDFLTWQRHSGILQDTTYYDGDANDDDRVDQFDLQIWLAEFGKSASRSAVSTIPEPSTTLLVLMLSSLLLGESRTLRSCIS